jgi:hypothetical protein
MKIEMIRSPSESFLRMLYNNVRPNERQRLEEAQWGAVGLVQGKLIELYRSVDLAEKASQVMTALVMGNCPQHIQMLAVLGKEAAVKTAIDKIAAYYQFDR